jgi:hypothetical protein
VVDYWPRYKATGTTLQPQQGHARELGAELVALDAGRSAILYHRAKADLERRYPGAYMVPNALKLPETVRETADEVARTELPPGAAGMVWVISISSGTIAAGVLTGLDRLGLYPRVVVHLGYSRPATAVRAYLRHHLGAALERFLLALVDEGYDYTAKAPKPDAQPFPCNPYYDLKARRWLEEALPTLKGDIVFWNIRE